MTHIELLPEIFRLSSDDQIMIVEAIRNHLAGKVVSSNEAAFKAELERRQADARANPHDESPLTDVMARLRKNR